MSIDPKIASIERATSRSWDEWLRFLDSRDCRGLSHKDIALKVHEELEGTMDSAGWWAQSVAVAYEHHIGRRVPGQRSDGTFQLSVSRSTSLGLEELMARWSDFSAGNPAMQSLLAEAPKTGGSDRRLTWRSRARDGSSVLVTSEPKKNGTASIVATQAGLPSQEANDAAREQWVELLTTFLERL